MPDEKNITINVTIKNLIGNINVAPEYIEKIKDQVEKALHLAINEFRSVSSSNVEVEG